MATIPLTLREAVRNSPYEVIKGELFSFRTTARLDLSQTFAVIKDDTETTVLSEPSGFPPDMDITQAVGPYTAIRLRPSAPFLVIGFLAYATNLLAGAECNILVVSTYSYDYLLVKKDQVERAAEALTAGGFPAYGGPDSATDGDTDGS
jgi:hypothetical protein